MMDIEWGKSYVNEAKEFLREKNDPLQWTDTDWLNIMFMVSGEPNGR
jgi:hypothetical protein